MDKTPVIDHISIVNGYLEIIHEPVSEFYFTILRHSKTEVSSYSIYGCLPFMSFYMLRNSIVR